MGFCLQSTPMKTSLPICRYMRKKAARIGRRFRRTAHIAQACEPTRTSPFLLLPRELRDYIYDYAFGSEVIMFTLPVLTLEAWPKGRKSENGGPDEDIAIHYPNTLPACTRGLPLWLLTNKQICSEALSYFGTVRTFARVDFHEIARDSTLFLLRWKSIRRQTPLVFNSDVIRNVTIRIQKYRGLLRESFFLEFLDRLYTKDLDLRLRLERPSRDDPCPPCWKGWKQYLDSWIATKWNTKKWGGRFRKVIISITTDCDDDEPVVDAAEFDQVGALARRLVGNVRTVTSGHFVFDYMDCGNKIYKRSIVVDRKD